MAKLDDLLAKASSKSSTIAFKSPRKTLGLRETMRSIREQDSTSSEEVTQPEVNHIAAIEHTIASEPILAIPNQSISDKNLEDLEGFKSAIPLSSDEQSHKSTIRAQLEHKISINSEHTTSLIPTIEAHNKPSIGAQLEHKIEINDDSPKSHWSTIRAQDEPPLDDLSSQITLPLEHNKSTKLTDVDKLATPIGAQLEHKNSNTDALEESTLKSAKKISLEHNKSTIRAQHKQSVSIGAPLEHKTKPIRAQKSDSLGHTLEHNKSTIHRLSGLEKKLLYFVYDICLGRGGRTSGPLTKAVMVEGSQVSSTSFKTVVKRVVDKGFLKRLEAKRGNGGFLSFEIPFEVYQDIMLNENKSTIRAQIEHDKSTDRSTNASSKLVSYINTNLLERSDEESSSNLPSHRSSPTPSLPEFMNADISALTPFGIYKKHLMDLHNQKQSFSLDQMEDFIWKFKEYVSDSEKVRGVRNIAALFITLARQLASGYDPLESIQTPEQKLLNDLIERNKKALLELKKRKEESRALEFEIWFEKLSRQERDELAPPNSILESGSDLQKKSLMGYFDKAIWNG